MKLRLDKPLAGQRMDGFSLPTSINEHLNAFASTFFASQHQGDLKETCPEVKLPICDPFAR